MTEFNLSDKIQSTHWYGGESYQETNSSGQNPVLDIDDVREAVKLLKEGYNEILNEFQDIDFIIRSQIVAKLIEKRDEIFGSKLI